MNSFSTFVRHKDTEEIKYCMGNVKLDMKNRLYCLSIEKYNVNGR